MAGEAASEGAVPSVAAAAAPLPSSLHGNRRLSRWLRFRAEGYVEVLSGKVEIGQGILTALAQIAAEELDVSLARVSLVISDTARTVNMGGSSAALGVSRSADAEAMRYSSEIRSA